MVPRPELWGLQMFCSLCHLDHPYTTNWVYVVSLWNFHTHTHSQSHVVFSIQACKLTIYMKEWWKLSENEGFLVLNKLKSDGSTVYSLALYRYILKLKTWWMTKYLCGHGGKDIHSYCSFKERITCLPIKHGDVIVAHNLWASNLTPTSIWPYTFIKTSYTTLHIQCGQPHGFWYCKNIPEFRL